MWFWFSIIDQCEGSIINTQWSAEVGSAVQQQSSNFTSQLAAGFLPPVSWDFHTIWLGWWHEEIASLQLLFQVWTWQNLQQVNRCKFNNDLSRHSARHSDSFPPFMLCCSFSPVGPNDFIRFRFVQHSRDPSLVKLNEIISFGEVTTSLRHSC